ncbi:unnamed protein product [Linum trigynum]|uniref:Uncharacterized protein n=1 Tax=Linum trigynum TaxID=586398 RepID=A0AAV2CEP6_9ROSI
MKRGALSSLLNLCAWLGRWLWKLIRLLCATYLEAEEGPWQQSWGRDLRFAQSTLLRSKRVAGKTLNLRGSSRGTHRTTNEGSSRKRRRVKILEDDLIESKKRRLQPLRGWRFWLPPSSAIEDKDPGLINCNSQKRKLVQWAN